MKVVKVFFSCCVVCRRVTETRHGATLDEHSATSCWNVESWQLHLVWCRKKKIYRISRREIFCVCFSAFLSCLSWLRPFYFYDVINSMLVSIVGLLIWDLVVSTHQLSYEIWTGENNTINMISWAWCSCKVARGSWWLTWKFTASLYQPHNKLKFCLSFF